MINIIYRSIFSLLFFFLTPQLTFAAAGENGVDTVRNIAETDGSYTQNTTGDQQMENLLRSNGLIYVVVGVILIVLAGLIFYLISLDRKLKKLEKEVDEKAKS